MVNHALTMGIDDNIFIHFRDDVVESFQNLKVEESDDDEPQRKPMVCIHKDMIFILFNQSEST